MQKIGVVLCLIFANCNSSSDNTVQLKKYSIGHIQFYAYNNSEIKVLNGIDTYVSELIVGEKDTFFIEYGKGIYNLHESTPTVFDSDQKHNIEKLANTQITQDDNVFFSETPEKDREENIFCKQYYLYDTINNMVIKLVQPKKIGLGISGVFILKLPDGNSFSIYAKNLDSISHKKAVEMFRTISYE